MKNILDMIIPKKRTIYVCNSETNELLKALATLDSKGIHDINLSTIPEIDTSWWRISFKSAIKKWSEIRDDLNVKRVWIIDQIPKQDKTNVYSTD